MSHKHHHHHHGDDCCCGCGEENRISLVLEDDSELLCDVIGIFKLDESSEQEYIALVPVTDDEDQDILIYRYNENEEGPQLGNIESDEEYDAIAKVFDELFSEVDEEE